MGNVQKCNAILDVPRNLLNLVNEMKCNTIYLCDKESIVLQGGVMKWELNSGVMETSI